MVSLPSKGVAHVEINRPQKLNAFDRPMWLEYGKIFEQLSDDPEVRVVVLSAAGERAFTAGLDVEDAANSGISASSDSPPDAARRAKQLRATIEEFQKCVSAVEKCEKRRSFFSTTTFTIS